MTERRRAVLDDTWAYRALWDRRDSAHETARSANELLVRLGAARFTTNFVLDETLTGLRAHGGWAVAVAFGRTVRRLESAGGLKVVTVDAAVEREAFRLFERLNGKLPRLSYTDCTSFAVMRALRIRLAFTADRHFDAVGADLRALVEVTAGGHRLREELLLS